MLSPLRPSSQSSDLFAKFMRIYELMCINSHMKIVMLILFLQFQYFLKDPVKYDVKYQVRYRLVLMNEELLGWIKQML